MSILRKRNKKASNKKGENNNSEVNVDLSSSGMKSSVVSGVVKQLQQQGYTGDLIGGLGGSYRVANPATQEENEAQESIEEVNPDLVTDDIDFDKSKSGSPIKTKKVANSMSYSEMKRNRDRVIENRRNVSKEQVDKVNKSAKKLYKDIDSFINDLRSAANSASDNRRLCMKLESLRKMCISFSRGVQNQLPSYATSLFVNPEEE